jgi:hypothetical protein
MIRTWSFHHRETGLFNGCTYSADSSVSIPSAANTPPDHVPLEGVFDHLSQRVDLATGQVVDYQPPAPSPDHEWNATTKRWQLSQAAQARAAARQAAERRIAALEAGQHRTLREAALGLPGAHDRLAAVEAEITGLREALHC